MQFKNALSVDVEDWFQGMLGVNYREWANFQPRLEISLNKILGILRARSLKATFFVLGYIAHKQPDIIKRISDEGHEIACHGYAHKLVYSQSKEEFRQDVSAAKEAIEKVIKRKIYGFRAPFFSITRDSLWALDILAELGFTYDSSIFPVKNFLYGIPEAPQTIYRAGTAGKIIEFPLSVVKIKKLRLPVCGGFYLRCLPYALCSWGIKHFNKEGWPAVVYLHPWEMDIEKPRLQMGLKWRIIHECNINKMQEKFERLIKDFSFTTISGVLNGS